MMPLRVGVLVLAVVSGALSAPPAQTPSDTTWLRAAPEGRSFGAMAFDALSNRTVLFGGQVQNNAGPAHFNDH